MAVRMTPSRQTQERLYRDTVSDDALARQKREAATKCKNCAAPVIWARDGATFIPLAYDEHEGGPWFLFSDATCYRGRQEDATPPGATRHYDHRAICSGRPPAQESL